MTGLDPFSLGLGLLAGLVISRLLRGSREPRDLFDGPSQPIVLPDETLRAVHDLVRDDRLIDAIKFVRKHSGVGLRDAKLFVDAQYVLLSQHGDDKQ